MDAASVGLGFLAGVLSILSPCVLPVTPLVIGAAAGAHRFGPVALAGGLAVSFVVIGLFVATIGFGVGLDGGAFRLAGGVVMMALGAVLLVPSAQVRLAAMAGPVSDRVRIALGGFVGEGQGAGLGGKFGVGLLLGAVWSPCVGSTLGAASVVAARGESLGSVALVMLAFGLGAGLPLALLGLLSREALMRSRGRLMGAGGAVKMAMGAGLLAFGLLVVTGLDKSVEAWLVEASPEWLTNLTTRY